VLAQISAPSAAHLLKSHQLLVQKLRRIEIGKKALSTRDRKLRRIEIGKKALSMARPEAVPILVSESGETVKRRKRRNALRDRSSPVLPVLLRSEHLTRPFCSKREHDLLAGAVGCIDGR
jgi:hypothetical protein